MSECRDSDGANYLNKGNVTLKFNGSIQVIDDYCTDGTLTEMICNSNGTAAKINQVCENGCNEGKCNAVITTQPGRSDGRRTRITSTDSENKISPITTSTGQNTPSTSSGQSNDASEGNGIENTSGCKENSECLTNLCLNGECVGLGENNNINNDGLNFIEIICNIANPFDEVGYNRCSKFFSGFEKVS